MRLVVETTAFARDATEKAGSMTSGAWRCDAWRWPFLIACMTKPVLAGQLSMNVASLRERAGSRSISSAFASI